MRISSWLATATVSAATLAGPNVQADLFDRFRDRSDRAEKPADAAQTEDAVLIAAAIDRGEIGKIVTPVAYQPMPAPAADGPLTPVPDPSFIAPGPAYGGPTPAIPVQGAPAPGYPIEGIPGPAYPVEGLPFGGPIGPVGPGFAGEGFPLYDCVKYEDRDHIHPCATPIVVQVLDPRSEQAHRGFLGRLHHRNDCDPCGPQYVYVEICVPPGCPEIKVSRGGTKVKYKYDDYQVEITSKKGVVYVDYDD